MLRPGHARGDVVVDEIGHAVAIGQAVARREVDARLPFLGADLIADRTEAGLVVHRGAYY
ncbi:hypothetical protein D3C83_134380 [compost metagenome]